MNTTVAGRSAAIVALRLMAVEFPDLPAPDFAVRRVNSPDNSGIGIVLSLHDSLAHFERWRTALALDPGQVNYSDLTSCQCLTLFGTYAGVPIELVGFAPAADSSW